jgi:large subunit ribosomal protein L10
MSSARTGRHPVEEYEVSKIRPEKVAVIDDVKGRVDVAPAAVVTEYRGMTVAEISDLRRKLRAAGADYKVLKNTLVRRAIEGTPSEPMSAYLEGPTAIAFVQGDVSAVAKVLRDFSKATPTLVLKGGVLDGKAISPDDLKALAELPSREVLLAQLAGLIASPMRTMAGLLKAVPQNFAYGLSALLDTEGGPQASASSEPEATETPAGVEDAAVAASDDVEAPASDAAVETEAPVAEAEAETPAADEAADAEPAE